MIHIRKRWLWLPGSLLIVAFIAENATPLLTNGRVLYPLEKHGWWVYPALTAAQIILLMYGALYFTFRRSAPEAKHMRRVYSLAFLLWVVLLIPVLTYVGPEVGLQVGCQRTFTVAHDDKLITADFYITQKGYIDDITPALENQLQLAVCKCVGNHVNIRLYQCDRFGLICDPLTGAPPRTVGIDMEYACGYAVQLHADAEAVRIMHGNEEAYRHDYDE